MMVKLDVYIADDCWSCAETGRLVSRVQAEFPAVSVETINVDTGRWPSYVFAAPTFVLNGRVISLGNPGWQQLRDQLRLALRQGNKRKQAHHATVQD